MIPFNVPVVTAEVFVMLLIRRFSRAATTGKLNGITDTHMVDDVD